MRSTTFDECGCCSGYHRDDYFGDCRDDEERFNTAEAEEPDAVKSNETPPQWYISAAQERRNKGQ